MNKYVVFTVIDIVALVAGLAIYLYIVGRQLTKVASSLEEAADLVWKIKANADNIEPNLTQTNTTGNIVAGALPLLYSMAEGIVVGATYVAADVNAEPVPARPAMGVRRSRMMEGVGATSD